MKSPDIQCEILLGFAGYLMLLVVTVSALLYKNHFEQMHGFSSRKVQEFYMDSLKQVVGAVLLQTMNSWIVSYHHSGTHLPVCHDFLLEILVDRSLGVGVLLAIFKIVSVGKNRWMQKEQAAALSHGQYYVDGAFQLDRFYKQLLLWCVCVVLMKQANLCIIHFCNPVLMPLLRTYVGAAELSPFIVILIFPAMMNAFQVWTQDNFLQSRTDSKAPDSANILDPLLCFKPETNLLEQLKPLVNQMKPENNLREHLKPLMNQMVMCCDCEPQKNKGKGKGKGKNAPAMKGVGKGKAPGKGKTVRRNSLPGPRPAQGLTPKRNFKLHWKCVDPSEDPNHVAGSTIWDKIRHNVRQGKSPELPGKVYEEAFMESKCSDAGGDVEVDELTFTPSCGVGSFGNALDRPRKSWRRSIKAQLIWDQQGAFNLNLAYKSLEQKGLNDIKELDGVLGRREEFAPRPWSEVPDQESLEAILKFLDLAVKFEEVLTIDATSETPSETFAISLVIDCGDFSDMRGRVQALLAKKQLEVNLETLEAQYARIKDNVHYITTSSTKLPEILQHALQLGNYVNHGSSVGDAEAIDLGSLVTSFSTAKCKPKRSSEKEVSVFQFLAKLLREHRDASWMEQLNQDLSLCCEARDIDPAELSQQVRECKEDLKVIMKFAESRGPEDPPALSPEELSSFSASIETRIDTMAKDQLEKERQDLANYLTLADKETTIPVVLENLATLHSELFSGGWQQRPAPKKKDPDGTLKREGARERALSRERLRMVTPKRERPGRRSKRIVPLESSPGSPESPKTPETLQLPTEQNAYAVEDWLRDNNFKGVNEPRIFFNPMATWVYPLHMAVMHKSPKVVRMLLDALADPRKTNLTASARELTPLRLAKYYESSFNFTSRTSKGAYEPVIKILEDAELQRRPIEDV